MGETYTGLLKLEPKYERDICQAGGLHQQED